MKVKDVVDNTANRGEFNRAYKVYLERQGRISCSYCGYHRNENKNTKWYGGFVYDDMETCRGKRKGTNTRFPNWKLVSKNKKQWMIKPMVITKEKSRWNNNMIFIDITW